MVRHKIIWSQSAKIKLFIILEFYTKRNKSRSYATKLYLRLTKELKLLLKQPEMGIKTEMESVRGLIVDEFILFYEFDDEKIVVHSIWDCRQNPDHLRIK